MGAILVAVGNREAVNDVAHVVLGAWHDAWKGTHYRRDQDDAVFVTPGERDDALTPAVIAAIVDRLRPAIEAYDATDGLPDRNPADLRVKWTWTEVPPEE